MIHFDGCPGFSGQKSFIEEVTFMWKFPRVSGVLQIKRRRAGRVRRQPEQGQELGWSAVCLADGNGPVRKGVLCGTPGNRMPDFGS